MKFSVCLPATRAASVGATVGSIRAQTVSDWELLVIGQGADAAVREAVRAAGGGDPRVRYMHIERHGSSRARTVAMRVAAGDIIAMTDDDCEARPDWLAVLGKAMADEPDVAVVGGALIAPAPDRPGVRPARCPSLLPADVLYDPKVSGSHPPPGWDWIGANFAVRREVAEQVGAWDEYLGVGSDFASAGDSDYKLRIAALGFKMRSTPRAVVYHTSGWRYGLRAVLDLQRRHARGMGGLAAKLTLLGEARGRAWLEATRHEFMMKWLRRRQPHRLPTDLRILWHFCDAYQLCLRHYRVDAAGLLFRLPPGEPARGFLPQRA